MDLTGKTVVVTGAAGGIGATLARRFAAEGAAGVVVSDLSADAAGVTAKQIEAAGGRAVAAACDVADEAQIRALVAIAEKEFGPVDLFCSNAGIASGAGLEASDADWSLSWSVNVMAHVYAARAVVPSMLERGGGYLLNTCSAAGLLTAAGDAPYSATKHAAVAFAEWLSVMHGDAGLKVSALCPQGVHTAMMRDGLEAGNDAARLVAASGPMISAEQVADAVIEGLAAERFLILPHPDVATYQQHKATDPDRWLAGMRRFVAATLGR
jgi:NAD(P)-dependent dehydrogenase (short-subunit alcohol dehydrogenase family)